MTPRKPAKNGFTLVELLVVIGIISVLVGILLPSLSAARRQAQVVQCMSNMRQVGSALVMHAGEHAGYVPLVGKVNVKVGAYDVNYVAAGLGDTDRRKYDYALWSANTTSYYVPMPVSAALAPYLSRGRIMPTEDGNKVEAVLNDRGGIWKFFMCPSTDSYNKGDYTSGGTTAPLDQGALVMVYLNNAGSPANWWSSNGDYVFNEAVFGYDYTATARRLGGKLTKVQMPASTVLFTDGKRRSAASAPGVLADGYLVWSPNLTSKKAASLASSIDGTLLVADSTSFDYLRHKRKINVAFADGHCETRAIAVADLGNAYLIPPPR